MYQLTNIHVERGKRTILAIDELSIDPTAFTVVLGHNGSGKSTLLNLLTQQFAPEKGEISLNGKPLSDYKARQLAQLVAYLPQQLPQVAGMTVQELCKLGRFPWRGSFGRWQPEDYQAIEQAITQTDLLDYRESFVDELSGGERQRAFIAMLLAQQSPLLVLDEPTSALDISHQYQLMELLQTLNKQTQKGIVVIIHELNLALRYATNVIALKDGEVAFSGPKALLENESTLSELFASNIKLLNHPQDNSKVATVCL
ncbi:ABC transporter ATP-binding protein [Agarivorans sp. Alg241-V36]|nr:ABC transporter ATP-binding protein [Agarivorans sp. Alg241-V36]